jgi:predicted nucleotidyltransferase
MDASPILGAVASALNQVALDAVLIGNAAAALHGAPVTTVDFDFFYRDTPKNEHKLRQIAELLDAKLTRPFPDTSSLRRIQKSEGQLQLDFTAEIHGAKSFNSVKSRAHRVTIQNATFLVADLADIIRSKRAAARPADLAVMHVLEATLREQESNQAQRNQSGEAGGPEINR